MDRTLNIFKASGHRVAEIVFNYEQPWARAFVTEFRQLYADNDPDDESKSVYELSRHEETWPYQQLGSIEQVQAFDQQFAREKLWEPLSAPVASYRFDYGAEPVQLRYFLTRRDGVAGVVDMQINFLDNHKQVHFRSGQQFKFDSDISTNSLETNFSCLSRILIGYEDYVLPSCELHKVDQW